MECLPDIAPTLAPVTDRTTGSARVTKLRTKMWGVALLWSMSLPALCAPHAASPVFGGVLHARGPHGVFTEIRFAPHRLVAQVHEPHMCVLHAHLVHGDPHASHYAIDPPTGGRFCDELVDGEIVIHPHSPNEVVAEFRSPRMDWTGQFRRHTPGH